MFMHHDDRDLRFEDVIPLEDRILLPEHKRWLEQESGIDPAIIEGRGYFSLTRAQIYELTTNRALMSRAVEAQGWLGIPVYRLDGNKHGEIVRLFDPAFGVPKYLWPNDLPLTFDVHPDMFDLVYDASIPILITEGTKKADALLSAARREGYPCLVISVSGCWGWRTRINESSVNSPDLDEIAWRGRQVIIIPDSDVVTNLHVWNGWLGFARVMANKTYSLGKSDRTSLVFVPPQEGSLEKQGADDYLASGKTLISLLAQRKLPEIVMQDTPPEPPMLTGVSPTRLIEDAGLRIPHLVASLIPEASITLLAGHTGTFKTWAMLQMCVDGALGLNWHSHPKLAASTGPYASIYVNKEMSGKILGMRLRLLLQHDRYTAIPDVLTQLDQQITFSNDATLDLSTDIGLWRMENMILRTGAKLVVLDSLSMTWHGDENAASEVGAFYTKLREISERTGVAWVIIHHLLKPTSGRRQKGDPVTAAVRGSGQLVQQADAVLLLDLKEPKVSVEHEKLLVATHAKARTDVELATWVFKFTNPDGLVAEIGYLGAFSEVSHVFGRSATATTQGYAPRGVEERRAWMLEQLRDHAPAMAVGGDGLSSFAIAGFLNVDWETQFPNAGSVPDPGYWKKLLRDMTDEGLLTKAGATGSGAPVYVFTSVADAEEDV